MPGEPVGTGLNLEPVGDKKPNVGRPVGGQVGSGVGDVAGATSQDFSNIDKSRLAAPLPRFPGIGGSPTFFDRTKQSIAAVFSVFDPARRRPPRGRRGCRASPAATRSGANTRRGGGIEGGGCCGALV